MEQHADQDGVSIQQLLEPWWEPLTAEQRQQLEDNHQSDLAAWAALPEEERSLTHPDKAVLMASAQAWLEHLLQLWQAPKSERVKALKQLAAVSLDALPPAQAHQALQQARQQIFAELLWNGAATKAMVRSVSSRKDSFIQAAASLQASPLDPPALLAELHAWADTPERQSAQRATVAKALRTLGHFTSKTTHTQAQAVGIVLPPTSSAIGPYLTAGLLMERGHQLWLDQTINDNTGRTRFCVEAVNGSATEEQDLTANLVRAMAAELYAQGHETGTDSVDPRLPQILLPTDAGDYVAVTPLHAQGFSAYLHSHWQPWLPAESEEAEKPAKAKPIRQSFGQNVSYGFSSNGFKNFTAIKTVPHALEPDRTVSNIPNRAILFSTPSLDEAHTVLARIRHKGFVLHLPQKLRTAITQGYLEHVNWVQEGEKLVPQATWSADTQKAIALERSLFREAIRYVRWQVEHSRDLCAEAISSLDETERKTLREHVKDRAPLDRYCLMDPEQSEMPPKRSVAHALAWQLYRQVESLKAPKDGKQVTLGFGVQDRRRFMRWAPQAIARALNH